MTPLKTGDILLFRPTSIMGYLASLITWSRYSHAAMIEVIDGVPYCLEVREFFGGRKIELEKYVGKYEVWRLKDMPYSRFGEHAVFEMSKFVGMEYGWCHIVSAVLLRFVRAYECRECKKHPPFCSEAVSRAYRNAGIDPRPDLADRFTLPGDLADSPYLEKIFEVF